MAGPATIVREIHRLRRHAHELESEIERAPRLLKGQQNRVAKQEEALKEAQESLKHLKVTSHEKEVQLKAALQQITKHEDQLNQAGSKKEYDALKVEIANGKQKSRQLEDEILDCLTQIDDRTLQIPELEKAVQQTKVDYAEYDKSAQVRLAELHEELKKTTQAIQQTEASLPSDVREQYDRLIAARGEDAMAAVQNRTCMACFTEITAQNYNDLMLSQFLLCKSCGRALYLPE